MRYVYSLGRLGGVDTTDLQTFNEDMARRKALADALNSSPDYLWQLGIGYDGKRAGTDLAQAIERETARIWKRVPKSSLRPDVWDSNSKG